MGAGREWNVDGPSGGGIGIVGRALVEALDVVFCLGEQVSYTDRRCCKEHRQTSALTGYLYRRIILAYVHVDAGLYTAPTTRVRVAGGRLHYLMAALLASAMA
jgi:hypothetical protein